VVMVSVPAVAASREGGKCISSPRSVLSRVGDWRLSALILIVFGASFVSISLTPRLGVIFSHGFVFNQTHFPSETGDGSPPSS